jgi:transposase
MTKLDTSTSISLRAARSLTLPQTPQTNDRARVAAVSPAQAVQEAARAIARNNLHPVCSPVAGVAFHPRALLAVLTYCYTCEIYASADIEDLMRRDANFRVVCGNQIPDAPTLRRFRRHNHEAIETCLHSVLRYMAEQRGSHPTDHEIAEQARALVTTAMLMDMNEN